MIVASRSYSLIAACGLLNVVASLVSEHGFLSTWVSVVADPGLESAGSVVVALGLGCPTYMESSQSKIDSFFSKSF